MKFIKRYAFAFFFALVFTAPSFGAATKVVHSIVKGTYAEIIALTGDYSSQQGFASDYGVGQGLAMHWNGSAWKLSTAQQLLGLQHTAVSCDADTLEKTLFTLAVPPMGVNTQLLIRTTWTITNSANTKTLKVKMGATTVYSNNLTTIATDIHDVFIRNRNATNAQIMGFGNSAVYGTGTGAIQTAAVETNAGFTLTITGQKDTSGEVLTLQSVDVFIIGGGT